MGFEYLTNIPLDKAREDYLNLLKSHGYGSKTEVIPVWDACGRVTAHAVYAHICAPHYAASAMDGVAVHAKDTFGATETTPITLKDGQLYAVPIRGKSGLITTLAGADGYFCIDRDCEGLPKHAEIQVTVSMGD